jgi:hypothetical protein
MLNTIKGLGASHQKFAVTLLGVVAITTDEFGELSTIQQILATAILVAFILGQSIADFGKGRAIFEAGNGKAAERQVKQ